MTIAEGMSLGKSENFVVPQFKETEESGPGGEDGSSKGTRGAFGFKLAKTACLIVTWICLVSNREIVKIDL